MGSVRPAVRVGRASKRRPRPSLPGMLRVLSRRLHMCVRLVHRSPQGLVRNTRGHHWRAAKPGGSGHLHVPTARYARSLLALATRFSPHALVTRFSPYALAARRSPHAFVVRLSPNALTTRTHHTPPWLAARYTLSPPLVRRTLSRFATRLRLRVCACALDSVNLSRYSHAGSPTICRHRYSGAAAASLPGLLVIRGERAAHMGTPLVPTGGPTAPATIGSYTRRGGARHGGACKRCGPG